MCSDRFGSPVDPREKRQSQFKGLGLTSPSLYDFGNPMPFITQKKEKEKRKKKGQKKEKAYVREEQNALLTCPVGSILLNSCILFITNIVQSIMGNINYF